MYFKPVLLRHSSRRSDVRLYLAFCRLVHFRFKSLDEKVGVRKALPNDSTKIAFFFVLTIFRLLLVILLLLVNNFVRVFPQSGPVDKPAYKIAPFIVVESTFPALIKDRCTPTNDKITHIPTFMLSMVSLENPVFD
jgi:hypothetical protein